MEGSHPVVELNDGDTATLSEDVYAINFAPGTAATTVKLSGLQQSDYFALFMEHAPSEFSAALLGPEGDVEAPVLEGGEEQSAGAEQSGNAPIHYQLLTAYLYPYLMRLRACVMRLYSVCAASCVFDMH
jgi:hypothetical protein